MRNIIITIRYLSTVVLIYKTIYLFDWAIDNRKFMIKMLEAIGFGLIAIMFIAFVGFIPGVEPGLSAVFWGCAVGALGIIFYRKKLKDKQDPK